MFSYTEYKNIIALITGHLPIVDFKEALRLDKFCVIRHDIEFSIDRALKLAVIERELSVNYTSTRPRHFRLISRKFRRPIFHAQSLAITLKLPMNLLPNQMHLFF